MEQMKGSRQHHVLVVDDDPAIRNLHTDLLGGAGYDVTVASDGDEALARVEVRRPDLVLLDLDMPRVSGYEVCRRLKADPRTRFVPVVILTGAMAEQARLLAWELGADDFLTKPFRTKHVLTRCRALLRVKDLVDQLDDAQNVLFALTRAMDAKSAFTQGHTERVVTYALTLGKCLGLSAADLDALRLGAALHDIGKISIPDEILNKPGRLTVEEMEVIKRHPVAGVRIVEPLQSVRHAIPLIRWHHERLDGGGYPDGISGDAISMAVRILSVVDVYDAMSTARPYRPALSYDDCLATMRKDADGGGLDHEVIRCFCETLVFTPPEAMREVFASRTASAAG
jgi:putative two-component system response regulator